MAKKKLYILTLEKIEQRYTKQWYSYFMKEFSETFDVVYIDGVQRDDKIKKGRFLDINKTNLYKAEQVESISKMFMDEKIKDGDIFFFMDFWHFGITALKYMAQLNKINIKIYAYAHAGTYDRHDFLSQAGMRSWASYNEYGWVNAIDGLFVATFFHKTLISDYFCLSQKKKNKIHVVGFPMNWPEYINSKQKRKRNIVVFPHRLDKEKQPEVFDKLSKKFKDHQFIKTLKVTKNKIEYYNLLAQAKICISVSLQETFGIGTVEAMNLGCIPIVPDTLAYRELYHKIFRYNGAKELKQKTEYFIHNYQKPFVRNILRKNKYRINKLCKDSINKMTTVMLK